MSKEVAFVLIGFILLLAPQSHGSYDTDKSPELLAAIKSGKFAEVEQLLATGAEPNLRRPAGITPLALAALVGRADIVKLLVDSGADLNAKSDNGMTALMIAAEHGRWEVTKLLLGKGADPNILNPSGLTAFQIATLREHSLVAALLEPHTKGTEEHSLRAIRRFHAVVLFPGLLGLMGLFFLFIGLRGAVTNEPFLISERWLWGLMLIGGTPVMIEPLMAPTSGGESGMLTALSWLASVIMIVSLIFASFTMRGYIWYGVTDISFREGLVHSLKKLNLPYEETLSAVKLPTLGADLQVAVQSWEGTGQLKMKQRQFGPVLNDIVNGMNEYYQSGIVSKINLVCCIFHTVIGVLLAVLAGVLFFALGKIV